MNQTFTQNNKSTRRRRTMDAPSTYKFEQAKREYIVEPVFKSDGETSLFSLPPKSHASRRHELMTSVTASASGVTLIMPLAVCRRKRRKV